MEHILRCNALKCRRDLSDLAVVTTCRYTMLYFQLVLILELLLITTSHVFCVDCAKRLQLSDPPAGQRPVCPACDAHLTNPDDAVITNLNPTEDYKTSVLSGLSPNIIMECAGRALSFWAYQITQEVYVSRSRKSSPADTRVKSVSGISGEVSDRKIHITQLPNGQDHPSSQYRDV